MMTTIAIEGTNKKVQDFLKAIEGFATLAGVTVTVGNAVSEEPKAETKKATASKSKTASSSKKVDLKAFEPKKDEDGYYNWNSWKKARDRYLKAVGKDYDTIGKVERDEYLKNVEPFAKKFPYVKKDDRK